MVLNGRIVYATSYNDRTDVITVEFGGRGAPIKIPLTDRIILIEGDGPRVKVIHTLPANATAKAEDEFDTFCHRRDVRGIEKRDVPATTDEDDEDFSVEAILAARASAQQRMEESADDYERRARERREKRRQQSL